MLLPVVVDPISRYQAHSIEKEQVGGTVYSCHIAIIGCNTVHWAKPSITVGITC